MSKSPEEYFQEQNFSDSAPADNSATFSPAEKAFMEKYVGLSKEAVGISEEEQNTIVSDGHKEMSSSESLITMMRNSDKLQMVAFYLGQQEFTIPTIVVQEVIRAVPIAKLPAAPGSIAGVINLRGKVTPLIHLRETLEVSSPRKAEDKFIIVCRRQGIQMGMIIERVHTMYLIPQEDIDWGIENSIGVNDDYIAGLVKLNDVLLGIVNVDRVIDGLIN